MKILRDREGMRTFLTEEGKVAKVANDQKNLEWLRNAYRFFVALSDTPYVPKGASLVDQTLFYNYVEETPDPDPRLTRHNVMRMLLEFRKRNIVHGDLTRPNVVFNNNVPVAIDWDQSTFAVSEARPQKRPKPDIVHIMPVLINGIGDPGRIVQRWWGLRDYISYYFGWGTFLDIGTHYGDHCSLALAEGMKATGIDAEKIRPCIDEATKLWSSYGGTFIKGDIATLVDKLSHTNVIMMFSTWPYVVQDHGRNRAEQILSKCIELSDIFLFECQLYKDGPGPEFLKTKDDIVEMLYNNGATSVEEAVTVQVAGRDAERTVWAVK